jgi:hypothetical protein
VQWLIDTLQPKHTALSDASVHRISDITQRLQEAGLEPEKASETVCSYVVKTATHNSMGLMRRHLQQGFARAVLLDEEADLASFLTYGFAELDFRVRPSRQDLVLSLFKALMEVFRGLKIPVVVAFDQLEDLLLARRSDDSHRVAEAFFAGIVQAMHQIDGVCFLIFAERGLWNRFVPSLDGYIQDRLSNPVHVPQHGTIKTLRLESPPAELVRRVVEARMRPALEELRDFADLPAIFPFTDDQIERVAKTEPTLRDMLQQFRLLFDHLIYGQSAAPLTESKSAAAVPIPDVAPHRLPVTDLPVGVKSIMIVESPADPVSSDAEFGKGNGNGKAADVIEVWDQEVRAARRNLEPDGALTGATRELQSGLGAFLQICHEHGVKVGPWRIPHVVPEWTFGDHPTYGAISIAHWVCKDGQPWKVGIGLFLGRGPAKPKDLTTKLAALDVEPAVIDHLILLRPDDDLTLTGKSKTLWQEAEKRGRHARLEAVSLDGLAVLYAFPRFLACLTEALPQGQPLPNLADLLQEKCERLLEKVCMPVQGG